MFMKRNGIVLVVCAPSGAGKTTLVKKLLEEFPHFGYSVSCTTRAPREGEVDGKDYRFLGKEEFLSLRDEGYFAEWAAVHGNYYGTPLTPTLEMLHKGRDVIFDVDVQGAAQLRLTLPQGLYVFVLPPSMQELEERLRKRGSESEETLQRRLGNAVHEIRQAHWFDAWVVNDDLDKAYDELRAAYLAATLLPRHRPLLLRTILGDRTAS